MTSQNPLSKKKSFHEDWDKEYIEISFQDIEGDFYPNERGLEVIRERIILDESVVELVIDGDFDLRNNFDDDFYGFAHIRWDGERWVLKQFRYDKRTGGS